MSDDSEPKSSKLNQEDEQQECPTRLLEDTPADDDLLAFNGDIGPHKRVARAIAEVILSPHESGGKMIGLEGGWGAGKTTVINLLRKNLDGNPDITVFPFDAWAHEGDPLRRTFLETLIRHFQSVKGWLSKPEKKKWNKTLEKLANRRRVTTTRTVPKTTAFGTIFAISAFLVPVGVPLFLTSLRQEIPGIWVIFGSVLTAAPLIVLIGNSIRVGFKRLRKKYGKSSDKSKNDEKNADDWAFLQGKETTETTQDTTETPEPTSIEFEDDFRKLMQTALPESSKRQAVIVLDNLDRIDPKDALSIWATLQTFLQDRSTKTEYWFKKLWIIVPYDPTGLRQLWANRGAVDEDTEKRNSVIKDDVPAVRGEDADKAVPVSFIDKSFQLRFEVPPPVLSNWKAYLMKLVEEALPRHSKDQHMIYRVFHMCRVKGSKPPTPRELKLYVNQIGVIHRQWQHKFPIDHVAYYAILRRQNVNIFKGLGDGTLPEEKILPILTPGLRDNLAGLAFNVQAELGRQLILDDPIYDALAKNDFKELQNLEKLYKDGFWAILVVISPRLADADAITIANIASCLDKSSILKQQERNESIIVKRELARVASRIESWSPFDESLADGIASICQLASELDVSKKIYEALRQSILKLEKLEETLIVTEGVIKGLLTIFKKIDDLGHQDAFDSRPFTLPVDAQGWVEVCSLIKTQELKFWAFFQPNTSFDEISKILSEAVTQGQFSSKNLATVQVTQASPVHCNWATLAGAFEQRLNAKQNPKSEEANFLLHGLSLLRRYNCDEANAASKRLADGGHLMNGFHQAQSQNHVECKAWYIITSLEQKPDAAMPQNVGNATAGHNDFMSLLNTDDNDLAKQMVEILRAQGNLGLLFTILSARKQYDPLVVRCLRSMADGEEPEVLYTPKTVIDHWSILREHLKEDASPDRFEKLISHLCKKSSLIEDVQKKEGGFNHKNAGLYLVICKVSSSPSFCEWCRDGLATLDSSTWETELDHEGDALKLMLTLIDAGISVLLKQPYQDALVGHAKKVLADSVQPSDDLVSQRSKILGGLGTAARKVLPSRLRDAAMEQDGKCANGFFEMYGGEIADKSTLAGDKNIVARLFSPLVRERKIGGLRWLKEVFDANLQLLDSYSDRTWVASVQDFRERLQGELEKPADKEDEAHDLIVKIASTLGITQKETPPEDEAATEVDDTPEDGGSKEKKLNGVE
jgi:hypothetical protein